MGDGGATRVTDRGYAWVILVATFFAQAGSVGFSIGGIGVSLMSFGTEFKGAHMGSLGMIGSLRISLQFLSSLAVVPLAEKLGFRLVALGGCVLAAAAIAATIAATELWHVYILYGVIAGFGICCPYATTMSLLGQYFDRLKHIAFPVVAMGQAVGVLSFPPIVAAVHAAHGHVGMLAFMSGSLVICFISSLLLKPNDGRTLAQSFALACSPKSATRIDDDGKLTDTAVAAVQSKPGAADASSSPDDALPLSKKALEAEQQQKLVGNGGESNDAAAKHETAASGTGGRLGGGGVLGAMLDLLRRWQVCLLIVNSLLWGCCTSGTQALLPVLTMQHDMDPNMSALGMTMNGVGMLLASIVMTALGKCSYDRHLLYMLSCGLYGLPPLLLPLVGVVTPAYITLFSVCGWWLSTLLSLCNSVLFDMASGPAEFAKLIGLYFFANGVGCFIGPITVGSVSDSFTAAFPTPESRAGVWPAPEWPAWVVCGCFGFASTLVFIPTYVSNRRSRAAKNLHNGGGGAAADVASAKVAGTDEACSPAALPC